MQDNNHKQDSLPEVIRTMGPELGPLYRELQNEIEELQYKWFEFEELFANGPERIEVLNTVACSFFMRLQKLMFEDAMIHLSRLTDPPQTRDKNNLTVLRLAAPTSSMISDPKLKAAIEKATTVAVESCNFARDWRNRRLAHTDLETFRDEHVSPLPSVTSQSIKVGMQSLRGVMRVLEDHFAIAPCLLLRDPFGAKSLLAYLERAKS